MTKKAKSDMVHSKDLLDAHEFYMEILNCIPAIVYWIDADCKLKGCNNSFVTWLGMTRMQDFAGTPYAQMEKFEIASVERIDALRLDDMAVLFSGEAQYNIEEAPVSNKEGNDTYFLANRVPLFDNDKHINGLVVVLSDITAYKKKDEALSTISPTTVVEDGEALRGSLKARKILMIENNTAAQNIQKLLFETLDCEVEIADSGKKALALFVPGKYSLVLLEIGLDDISGYMVAKKIRKMEKDIEVPVPIIAITSYQAEIIKDDCHAYSMAGVLTQPLTSEQAMQIVQHYINKENTAVTGLISA